MKLPELNHLTYIPIQQLEGLVDLIYSACQFMTIEYAELKHTQATSDWRWR